MRDGHRESKERERKRDRKKEIYRERPRDATEAVYLSGPVCVCVCLGHTQESSLICVAAAGPRG